MIIDQDLHYSPQLYQHKRVGYYMSYIEGVVANPVNDKKTLTIHRFIIDTGAAITILNRSFSFLFKDGKTPIVDYVNIHYGGGISREPLPVYNVVLKIRGIEFKIPAAFDKNMTLTSLLGHFGFLNEIEHFGISKKRRKLKIVI